MLLVGGTPIINDVQKLRTQGCNIITATPGRLEELLTKKFPDINLHKSLKELVSLKVLILLVNPALVLQVLIISFPSNRNC